MPQDMHGVMHEFKHGELHSGKGGPVVKSRKQAIAIGLSEQRKLKGGGGAYGKGRSFRSPSKGR